jgi:hypothetical protein
LFPLILIFSPEGRRNRGENLSRERRLVLGSGKQMTRK